ncbi:MAG: protein-glutamate O-methyltransferase CheR [Opitutaceae bacterium]|nr:protein-glutamate O-methyltransferase CheR [Opitutaceae bacterium]
MNAADFDYVRKYVREQAAIVLEPGKEYLVESRLLALSRKESLASVDELMVRLRAEPKGPLHRKIVDAMTTNETSFFRDIHPFDALRKWILPEVIARRAPERKLTLWCGAASTGQEPFSVLMLIAEHFPALLSWDLRFIATDLCTEVLARARTGRFSQLEVNRGLPATLLVKHFSRQGVEWEVKPELRRRVEFREMNLLSEWSLLPPVDVIFLRNVLIYFDVETKKAILAKARRVLRPGGYLLLGGAETTINVDDAFERVAFDKTTCYRIKGEANAAGPAATSSTESRPALPKAFLPRVPAPSAVAAPS